MGFRGFGGFGGFRGFRAFSARLLSKIPASYGLPAEGGLGVDLRSSKPWNLPYRAPSVTSSHYMTMKTPASLLYNVYTHTSEYTLMYPNIPLHTPQNTHGSFANEGAQCKPQYTIIIHIIGIPKKVPLIWGTQIEKWFPSPRQKHLSPRRSRQLENAFLGVGSLVGFLKS